MPAQDTGLEALHFGRLGNRFVVVAEQVQRAMHKHMRPMRAQLLALRCSFLADDGGTDNDIAKRPRRVTWQTGNLSGRK